MFDTDAFRPLITWAEGASGKRYGTDARDDRAFRTLADHGRAMTFLAADGVRPGNEGRDYILRRIIRRAVSEAGHLGLDRRRSPTWPRRWWRAGATRTRSCASAPPRSTTSSATRRSSSPAPSPRAGACWAT